MRKNLKQFGIEMIYGAPRRIIIARIMMLSTVIFLIPTSVMFYLLTLAVPDVFSQALGWMIVMAIAITVIVSMRAIQQIMTLNLANFLRRT